MASRRKFLQQGIGAAAAAIVGNRGLRAMSPEPNTKADPRPNIVLILADDMGFSDIGCFGSEISTPNLDALATSGLRMSQFYNNPRCCPSRASIMTGLYSHQVGFGLMTDEGKYPYPAYRGDLSAACATIPEVLKAAGYNTAMTGKWHLTSTNPEKDGKHNWPLQRGFDRYYGIIAGASSYYNPVTLTRDNEFIPVPSDPNFYFTDALAENSAKYIEEFSKQDKPFFLYSAFNAPHWPIHAREEWIKKYETRYAGGWDKLREERHGKQIKMGLLNSAWPLSERDPRVPVWPQAKDKNWEMRRMAVYAAMIERLDRGVGLIVDKLKANGRFENTLIVFMSDNGGNYEELGIRSDTDTKLPIHIPRRTKDGTSVVHIGNSPAIMPGPEDTYQSIGIPWGNCTTTPFRLYKHYTHEGGISSPFIASWPKMLRIPRNAITHQFGHETDLMPTFIEIAKATYPKTNAAGVIPPMVGESLVPLFDGRERKRKPIFWEHEGNKAVRDGKWKLVSRFPDAWELHDMENDRTELIDLSEQQPEIKARMATMYESWAKSVGARPWPMPETPENQRTGKMVTPPYLRQ